MQQGYKYVTDRELAKRYNASRSTIWNWVRKGQLPQPIKLSDRTTRWDIEDIEKFESARRRETHESKDIGASNDEVQLEA